MYPFGSGYPPNNQSPYPQNPGYPPNPGYAPNPGYPNQTPYPNSSPFPGGAFGAGYPPQPNQSQPYPQSGYPPTDSAYPPVASAYPPTTSAYPPTSSPYPSQPSIPAYGGAAPNSGGAGYPPAGSYGGAPASFPQPTQQQSYPGYPAPSQPGYPPQNQPGYPPNSTNTPYPGQTQNPNPYPSLGGGGGASYPGYPGDPSQQAKNMASCFSEMKGHIQGIREEKRTPTIVPASPFDPVGDANALRKAMKGFGTDEDALINIICRRTNDQRQQIYREFKTSFGKDLIGEIKSETSGHFEEMLVALLTPVVDYYATLLREAMDGIGTDEDLLIEVLCSLSNYEIQMIKQAYQYKYRMGLENGIKSETSGHFKRLLVSLLNANRDESGVADLSQAQNDAQQLLAAGVGRMGTDESTFNLILCRRSYQQLRLINQEYQKIAGHTLEQAIKREFSGDIEDGLCAVLQCSIDRPEFFAKRLHMAMAGFGTKDKQLIRLLVMRSEIDLGDIKVAFERKYGKSLKSWIKGEASGDYKNCLLALIGETK